MSLLDVFGLFGWPPIFDRIGPPFSRDGFRAAKLIETEMTDATIKASLAQCTRCCGARLQTPVWEIL